MDWLVKLMRQLIELLRELLRNLEDREDERQHDGDEVPTERLDLKDDPELISPPVMAAPLYECAEVVVLLSFAPHADIEICKLRRSASPGSPTAHASPSGAAASTKGHGAPGAKRVVVDAIDDAARRFNEHHDFIPAAGNPKRLAQKLSTIAAALDQPWP